MTVPALPGVRYTPAAMIPAPATPSFALWNIHQQLMSRQFVDLTHDFAPDNPPSQGFEDVRCELVRSYSADGCLAHRYSFVGKWGAHGVAPAQLVPYLRTLDQIDVREMILPLVVIDISAAVAADPDYCVTIEDIRAWENKNGLVPSGSCAVLRSDWSWRWPNVEAMENRDAQGISHTPGWSFEVLSYLCEEADVYAIGHETFTTEPGAISTQHIAPLERYLLSTNRYQLALLTNLDMLPEAGALVVATFPKPTGGTAFPARVFAILP